MAHVAAQFVSEHISHQRLVLIRRVEDPIRFFGKAENRSLLFISADREGALWKSQRARASQVHFGCAAVLGRPRDAAAAIGWTDESGNNSGVRLAHDLPAIGVDDDQRK